MSHPAVPVGVPERSVATHLRVEGAVLFAAVLALYPMTGAIWWLFAALLLVPDVAMLGALAGQRIGAHVYNLGHNLALPTLLAIAGLLGGPAWLVPVGLIWIAHIAMDRALGFGLKYADNPKLTHVGALGKAAKESATLANAS